MFNCSFHLIIKCPIALFYNQNEHSSTFFLLHLLKKLYPVPLPPSPLSVFLHSKSCSTLPLPPFPNSNTPHYHLYHLYHQYHPLCSKDSGQTLNQTLIVFLWGKRGGRWVGTAGLKTLGSVVGTLKIKSCILPRFLLLRFFASLKNSVPLLLLLLLLHFYDVNHLF